MRSDPADSAEPTEQGRLPARTRRMSKSSGVVSVEESDTKASAENSLSHGVHKLTAVGRTSRENTLRNIADRSTSQINYDNLQVGKEDSQEMKQLKELMLVHLDLIQQQQELLLAKDRQIQSLKSETDTLKCRLERMERRMSLVRQQGDSGEKRGHASRQEERREANRKSHVRVSSPATSDRESSAPNRGTKRKGSLEPQNLSKRFSSSNNLTPSSQESRTRSVIVNHYEMSPNKLPYARFGEYKRPMVNDIPAPRDHTSWPSYIRRPGVLDGVPDAMEETKEKIKHVAFVNKEPSLCRTRVPYFVVGDEDEDDEVKVSKKMTPEPEVVFVPSWRIMKIPTGFSMEGTEALDDEIFNKRHQKPEQEEKRRKRWDMQRMREQSLYERLQQQQGRVTSTTSSTSNGSSKDECGSNVVSFMPDPEEAKYIEVRDDIPVSAFGYPLPKFSQSEFELPWFSLDKREQQERSKSSRKKR